MDRVKVDIGLLGDGNVGKTALAYQICTGRFVETYEPTIETCYERRLSINGKSVDLILSDCGACEELKESRNQMNERVDGLVLVYSITSWDSFNEVQTLCKLVQNKLVPMVLVGNKCDRWDREVYLSQGKWLANEMKCKFFEVSAKSSQNVDAIMATLMQQLARARYWERWRS